MSSCSKILILNSLIILALSAVLVGCAPKTPALEEIVNTAVAATTKAGTYKYDLDMETNAYKYVLDTARKETGGENTTMKAVMKVGGTLDIVKKEMHTTVDYSGSLQGQLTRQLPFLELPMHQVLSLEFFATSNESYMKLAVPLRGEHWAKVSLDVWEYLDQAAQQVELLKTAAEVDLLGTEEVNGIDFYILKTTPDSEKLARWLSRQWTFISLGNAQAKKEELLSFSIKLWIARDSYLLTKTEFEIKHRDRVGDNDIKGQINFYDYNQPVSITIPQEARKAIETGTPK